MKRRVSMAREIRGIIPAVITPFDSEEKVDEKAFRTILNYLIESGVHGIFPAGSQGEFFTLKLEEKKRLIEIAIEEARGRAFVMAHTGAITTRDSIELSKFAEKAGADCLSVITPFFVSPNQDELFDHYRAICESVNIPVLAYNNPDRTGGVRLTAQTIGRLAQRVPNFRGIKESSGDLSFVTDVLKQTPTDFKFIMGRDTLILGALLYGAAGAVAATANVAPKIAVGIYEAFLAGDYQRSLEFQRRLSPIRNAFALGSYPAPMKEALNLMGLPAGRCRSPIQALRDEERARLRRTLQEAGLL
jgi:4-hydroxy-tetrahydrodipicolinate synthase